jgi:four helix bundle protein
MDKEDFKRRTQEYALSVIALVEALPRARAADVIGRQLLRAATSVGANYRSACRARSAADFIAKMGIVEEEADECLYWLELLIRSGLRGEADVARLLTEGNQLIAMTVSSINTTRERADRRRIAQHS